MQEKVRKNLDILKIGKLKPWRIGKGSQRVSEYDILFMNSLRTTGIPQKLRFKNNLLPFLHQILKQST